MSESHSDSFSNFSTSGFTDQLNIETPEQVELRFPVAGLGSRFLALLADTLIQAVALLSVILLFILVVSGTRSTVGTALNKIPDSAAKWFIAGVILFYFLLYWGYFSLFEAFWNGQTPGKKLLKIRVIKDSGRQITFFEALARNLLRIVDLQFGYLVGVICMLTNKLQKRLGDFVAGTIVIHERTEDQPVLPTSRTFNPIYQHPQLDPFITPQTSNHIALPADAIARLTLNDLNLIDAFLTRALDLDPTTRQQMASRISERIAATMHIPAPTQISPERFLEAVAFHMRATSRS